MVNNKYFKHEFGGKERTFWLGLGFLSMFLKESDTTIETFDKSLTDNPFEMIPTMVFCSLKYSYVRVGANLDFNKFEVIEWIDEAGGVGGDFVVHFLDKFSIAMSSPKTNEVKELNNKKVEKVPQKKTKALK